jgi:HlyD family secretion protein
VTALFRHQAGWAVFLEEAGSARLRRVEIGHRAGLVTEVTAGLAAGDRVIASPSERIADGVAVVGREAR